MYFDVRNKQVFASTGGETFNNNLPTIIFLHGSGLDHTFWDFHSRQFVSRNYSVLAPDLPGHTHSDGPTLKSIESMAEWLNDVVGSLAVSSISIVGHSQGCLVALEYAARYSADLSSVSLVASGLATPVNNSLMDAATRDPEEAISMMMSWGFSRAARRSMILESRKVMRRNVPNGLVSDLEACNNYRNGKTAAGQMPCPVQVIQADKDRLAPRKATAELIENLRNPEVHLVSNSGHMLPIEAPDECDDLLNSFIFANNPAS